MMDVPRESHDVLVFFCNGQKIEESHADPESSIAVYLRTKLQLTGCKIGCSLGACGTCTVMVSSIDPETKKISHIAVNACLYPLCALHGKAVTTVEGIGSTHAKLHPVQERLAKAHGSQCGFCSPGMVMSMYTLLRNNPKPTSQQVLSAMEGNWCRCTGYRPILDAFNTFTQDGCRQGQQCCRIRQPSEGDAAECTELFRTSDLTDCVYDPSQDIIFPPELMTSVTDFQKTVQFIGPRQTWISAATLHDLLELKSRHRKALIVAGNTYLGVIKDATPHQAIMMSAGGIKELQVLEVCDLGVKIGAMVTMTQLLDFMKAQIASLPEIKTRTFVTIVSTLNRYAGQQIRNVSTLGGHIMIAGSDVTSILLAAGCHMTVVRSNGKEHQLPMDETFHSKEGWSFLASDEVLLCVDIPFTTENQYICAYKMTPKKQQGDLAILNAAYQVTFEPGRDVIKMATFVYAGLRPNRMVVFATNTSQKAIGRPWNKSLLESITSSLGELTPDPSIVEVSVKYMHSLIIASFFKFYVEVQKQLTEKHLNSCTLPTSVGSVVTSHFPNKVPRGTAVFEPVPAYQKDIDPLGRPLVHRSALQQASGEAFYVDDMPRVEGELHLALVLVTCGRATVLSMDASEALAMKGVVTYITAEDVPGNNVTTDGEEIFVTDQVYSVGQIHGAVVAVSPEIARQAAKLVKLEYDNLPALVTIEDAMQQESIHGENLSLGKGNPEGAFNDCPVVFKGTIHTHGQSHWYLEPSSCVMRPSGEAGEIEVFVGFQFMKRIQVEMAKTLNVDENKISCHTKRVGGAFGGKSNRFLHYLACAVAVNKTRKSVRMSLSRSEDMRLTGHREANLVSYKVGCDNSGKIKALVMAINSNTGTPDSVNHGLACELLFLMDNVYAIDNIHVTCTMYQTNLPAITPMRAFASIENIYTIEAIVSDVATMCGHPQCQVRETNMHTMSVPSTYFGLPIEDFDNFRLCWSECIERSDYILRRREIDAYNSQNRWRKRGLSINPLKFNVGAYSVWHHQAGALVNAYIDGSILIHIGGVEIGQGLYTKMIQIASRVLAVPVDCIHIKETNTSVLPNQTDTAASSTSDIFGMAVKEACKILVDRLEPYKEANPLGAFKDWVYKAHRDRVYLSASGFYKTPSIDWSWKTKTGKPYPYSTYGVACSEVEIDCLTGNHQLIRTDIVMDIGRSINPAIDVGQIEGAFMMGYGYFTFEELRWAEDGNLITDGPLSYKIPSVMDVPDKFNVTLLRNSKNLKAVYSSKGVGEPAVCLANTVFFAIKDAIQSARSDVGLTGVFTLDTPATAEKIHLACGDGVIDFAKKQSM